MEKAPNFKFGGRTKLTVKVKVKTLNL